MLRLLLLLLTMTFFFSAALAAPTPVRKAEPFKVHLILKTVDGRALQHSYKAGVDLQTGPIGTGTTIYVMDWNGVELVAGDVISLGSSHRRDGTGGAPCRFAKVGLANDPNQSADPVRPSQGRGGRRKPDR